MPWGPTCLSAFRVEAVRSAGGFDVSMDLPFGGEDVDICMRLTEKEWILRGVPVPLAIHTTRTWDSPRGNFRRCFNYGRAESDLLERWPKYGIWNIESPPLLLGVGLIISLASWHPHTGLARLGAALLICTVSIVIGEFVCQRITRRKRLFHLFALTLLDLTYRCGALTRSIQCHRIALLVRRFDWFRLNSFGAERGKLIGINAIVRWTVLIGAALLASAT